MTWLKSRGTPPYKIVGGDNVVAGLHQVADRADGGHAAGEYRRGDAAFQRGEVLLQPRARGIAGARVVVAFGLAQLFLRVGRCRKDGRSDSAGGRIGVVADVDGASGKAGSVLLGHKKPFHHRDTEAQSLGNYFTTETRGARSYLFSCFSRFCVSRFCAAENFCALCVSVVRNQCFSLNWKMSFDR